MDVLVNCAGITCAGVLADLDPNQFTVSYYSNPLSHILS